VLLGGPRGRAPSKAGNQPALGFRERKVLTGFRAFEAFRPSLRSGVAQERAGWACARIRARPGHRARTARRCAACERL